MKTSHRCPKCGHGEVLHVPEPADDASDRMTIGSWHGPWTGEPRGKLEAYMCLRCGYAELYVTDADLAALRTLPGARVLTSTSQGPFR